MKRRRLKEVRVILPGQKVNPGRCFKIVEVAAPKREWQESEMPHQPGMVFVIAKPKWWCFWRWGE